MLCPDTLVSSLQIPKQLHITPLQPPTFAKPYPAYFSGPYIDIKEAMKNYLTETWYRSNCPEEPIPAKGSPQRFSTRPGPHRWSTRSPKYYRNLVGQLEALNMGKFQGRQHSGIDVSSSYTLASRTLGFAYVRPPVVLARTCSGCNERGENLDRASKARRPARDERQPPPSDKPKAVQLDGRETRTSVLGPKERLDEVAIVGNGWKVTSTRALPLYSKSRCTDIQPP
jgi:hypothetical protein